MYYLKIIKCFAVFLISGFILSAGVSYSFESRIAFAAHQKGGIKIELGKALELATEFKVISLAIGDRKIADVMPITPQRIRILGLKPGTTNLIVSYGEKRSEEYEICVNHGYKVEVIDGIITNPNTSLTGW